jgi:hypothetical protein
VDIIPDALAPPEYDMLLYQPGALTFTGVCPRLILINSSMNEI